MSCFLKRYVDGMVGVLGIQNCFNGMDQYSFGVWTEPQSYRHCYSGVLK